MENLSIVHNNYICYGLFYYTSFIVENFWVILISEYSFHIYQV